MSERQMKCPAVGFAKGLMKRVVVSFDDETFDEVRRRALKSGRSFGAEVRELVEFGLEDTQ